MNKLLVAVVIVGAMGLGSHSAVAQYSDEENYFGISLGNSDTSGQGVDASLVYLRAGFKATATDLALAVEARVGAGADDFVDGVKTKSFYGGYVTAALPGSLIFAPYVTIGITRVAGERDMGGGMTVEDSDTGFSYGGGVDMKISGNLIINFEYMKYNDSDRADLSAFAIGITNYFR